MALVLVIDDMAAGKAGDRAELEGTAGTRAPLELKLLNEDAPDQESEYVREPDPAAHRVRQRVVTGGIRLQAIRSFIPWVIGPQAAVWASRVNRSRISC